MKLTNKVLVTTFGLLVLTIFIFLLSLKLYVKNNLGVTATAKHEYSKYNIQEYDYSDFSALKLEFIKQAKISSGENYKISINKPKEVPVDINQNNAVLEITTDSEYSDAVEIEITMPELIHYFSKGHTKTEFIDFTQKEISLALDRNNEISARECQFEKLLVKSKGVIDIDFKTTLFQSATLQCDGFGDIHLKMDNGNLAGEVDGAIDVYIYGNATYHALHQKGLNKIKVID